MKLTLIGAGSRSVLFTQSLLNNMGKYGIDEFCIMDIDQERLDIFGNLCKYLVEKNSNVNVLLTGDEGIAFKNTDFIVTAIRPGKEEMRIQDEKIAFKYGVIGQETTGAGGFSMALRTVPAMIHYCKLRDKICPNAWIFNFTNPSGLITQAMVSQGFQKVIGICDTPSQMRIQIADALNVYEKDVYALFYGLNHLSWIKEIKLKDKDITQDVINDDSILDQLQEIKSIDKNVIRYINAIPNEYLYYYYYKDIAYKNIINSKFTRGEAIKKINDELICKLKEIDLKSYPEEGLKIYYKANKDRHDSYMSVETKRKDQRDVRLNTKNASVDGYSGVALDIIEGLNGNGYKMVIVSVPNNGAITGFKDDDVVEITCKVDCSGIHPEFVGEIPEDKFVLIKAIKLYENLTVDAISNNSKKDAINALAVHPLVGSYPLSEKLVNDYTELNKQYISFE